MMKKANFLLAGVGGQGTLLASDIVADVGIHIGFDVKKSEVHGMAQRGGAVVSHVRWADRVASPLCEEGEVDYFIAQEMMEAVRWLKYLKPGGTVILNLQKLPPTSTVFGTDVYPEASEIFAQVQKLAGKILGVDAASIAKGLGNIRTANSVLLGALSKELDIEPQDWLTVIMDRVPEHHKEVNKKAYLAGHEGNWGL